MSLPRLFDVVLILNALRAFLLKFFSLTSTNIAKTSCALVIILIVGCDTDSLEPIDKMEATHSEASAKSTDIATGARLYRDNCSMCHLPIDQSTKAGRTAEQIQWSIDNIDAMQHLQAQTSPAIILAIADVLIKADTEDTTDNNESSEKIADETSDEPSDNTPNETSDNSNGDSGELDIQAIMQLNDLNCTNSGCHSSTPGAAARINLKTGSFTEFAARLVDQPSGSPDCNGELLIDSLNPENSLLIKLIDPASGTQCMSKMPFLREGIPQEYLPNFMAWIDEIIAANATSERPNEPPKKEQPETSKPADALTVLTKAKFILHGGAVTDDEYQTGSSDEGSLDIDGYDRIIKEWMNTQAYKDKRRALLSLTLQQDPSDKNYSNQFNLLNGNNKHLIALGNNLTQSFVRTAERIIDNNLSFKEVITTKDWEVTVGMLAALRFADSPGIKGRLENELKKETSVYIDDDFTEWKTITMQLSTDAPSYKNASELNTSEAVTPLRALIENGGSFKTAAPRIGFLNSPAFFQKWITNVDNQFRLNTNQAMIAALGLTFVSGDNTPVNHLQGLDQNHAKPGSDCFGCHQHLDPMRNAFREYYSDNRQRSHRSDKPTVNPDFSFRGHSEAIENMGEFANAIANHPNFANAWTLKICQWATSYACNKDDPEIQEIAEKFADNYDFNELIIAFMKSTLVTHTNVNAAPEQNLGGITISRKFHYCSALNQRLTSIRENLELAPDIGHTNLCEQNNASINRSNAIPNDNMARGSVNITQSTQPDPMLSLAYDSFCALQENRVVGNKGVKTFQTTRVDEVIEEIVSQLIGIPESTDQYQPTLQTLRSMYDTMSARDHCDNSQEYKEALNGNADCGLALNQGQALKNIWRAVCQMPALTSVGL